LNGRGAGYEVHSGICPVVVCTGKKKKIVPGRQYETGERNGCVVHACMKEKSGSFLHGKKQRVKHKEGRKTGNFLLLE